MSDRIDTLPWQPWSLDDLSEQGSIIEPLPAVAIDALQLDVQAEQSRSDVLCQQAEKQGQQTGYEEGQQKGYANGQQKGYEEGFQSGRETGYQQGLLEAQEQQQPMTEH